MRSYKDLDVAGKTVLVRLDLNVPLEKGHIVSDARLTASLPIIQYLLSQDARVVVASHLGRPRGRRNKKDSLLPVAARLGELLDVEVLFCDDCIGDGVRGVIQTLRKGQIACLENLRFHAGEESNDAGFCRSLAAPFDVYINDAFGAAHRSHASTVGVVPLIRTSAAGPLFQNEVSALLALRHRAERPFVIAMGGAKIGDKIGMLGALLGKADTILIGGAMAYTFLAASGVSVGKSLVEPQRLSFAKELIERARNHETRIELPIDHMAAHAFEKDAVPLLLPQQGLPADLIGLDIGPQTRALYADVIRKAATVFWNGPMGVSTWPAFAAGTEAVCEATAQCPGHTVVGGGDSIVALEAAHRLKAISHVSTGGGASLALLEQGTLPGIVALSKAS